MQAEAYDAIVIGSGQGGAPLSIALAKGGWKTAIVERGDIGGTCVNVGCTPTKTMVASARVAYLSRRSEDYGVDSGPVKVSMSAVRKRKQKIVESFREGGLKNIEKTQGLDLLKGEARFNGPKSLEIILSEGGMRLVTAEKIFINTGARPAEPTVPGLDTVATLDSTSIMELEILPEHLLVMGGGYVGLEFGQMFRRFGSQVTIIHRGDHLLRHEDPDVADEVARILEEDGIKVLLNSQVLRAQGDDTSVNLIVRTPKSETTLKGSHLLVAVGRRPNSDRLNLQSAGVETDEHGFIKVNDQLETNVAGIYALGDVKGGPAFTHISYDDFRILRTNLIEGSHATTKGRLVPYTVFIDPQLGRIGITETEASNQGLDVLVAKLPMSSVARAIEMSETCGFMKAIVDAKTKQILGCAVLGIEGGELMAMFEIAMMAHLPYTVLRDAIFAHPTLAESLNNLFKAMAE
ncbi:MAG TPA: FAD-containing oxidoreductase [Blastocatellia bacterium]|jgi:pyruvate/2-oxoglutarate dehydrogenase complex dihydrolipoamide dehydrogenase (E3) component|nr:FAD-containing oxidoreductase [Blastocatellia bacterium]